VQTILVLRLVFTIAHHYTAWDEEIDPLTMWSPVLDNRHRIMGSGCCGETLQKAVCLLQIDCRVWFLYLPATWSRLAGAG
jgi:hypothetical protein